MDANESTQLSGKLFVECNDPEKEVKTLFSWLRQNHKAECESIITNYLYAKIKSPGIDERINDNLFQRFGLAIKKDLKLKPVSKHVEGKQDTRSISISAIVIQEDLLFSFLTALYRKGFEDGKIEK